MDFMRDFLGISVPFNEIESLTTLLKDDDNKPLQNIEQSLLEFPSVFKNLEEKLSNLTDIKNDIINTYQSMYESLKKFYESKLHQLNQQDNLFSKIALLLLGFNKNVGIGFINAWRNIRQQKLNEIQQEFKNRQLLEDLKVKRALLDYQINKDLSDLYLKGQLTEFNIRKAKYDEVRQAVNTIYRLMAQDNLLAEREDNLRKEAYNLIHRIQQHYQILLNNFIANNLDLVRQYGNTSAKIASISMSAIDKALALKLHESDYQIRLAQWLLTKSGVNINTVQGQELFMKLINYLQKFRELNLKTLTVLNSDPNFQNSQYGLQLKHVYHNWNNQIAYMQLALFTALLNPDNLEEVLGDNPMAKQVINYVKQQKQAILSGQIEPSNLAQDMLSHIIDSNTAMRLAKAFGKALEVVYQDYDRFSKVNSALSNLYNQAINTIKSTTGLTLNTIREELLDLRQQRNHIRDILNNYVEYYSKYYPAISNFKLPQLSTDLPSYDKILLNDSMLELSPLLPDIKPSLPDIEKLYQELFKVSDIDKGILETTKTVSEETTTNTENISQSKPTTEESLSYRKYEQLMKKLGIYNSPMVQHFNKKSEYFPTTSLKHPEIVKTLLKVAEDVWSKHPKLQKRVSLPLFKALVLSVAWQESRFNPKAKSKYATGLMGLTTSEQYGKGAIFFTYKSKLNLKGDVYDPYTNAYIGAYYLADLIEQYDSIALALGHYNGGYYGSRNIQHIASCILRQVNEDKIRDYIKNYGYPETISYVYAIMLGHLPRALQLLKNLGQLQKYSTPESPSNYPDILKGAG